MITEIQILRYKLIGYNHADRITSCLFTNINQETEPLHKSMASTITFHKAVSRRVSRNRLFQIIIELW